MPSDAWSLPPSGPTTDAAGARSALTDRRRDADGTGAASTAAGAGGASNLQIAHKLHLAEGTVKNHISLIMDKLGASNRTQAATIARQRRLIREFRKHRWHRCGQMAQMRTDGADRLR